MLNKYLIEFFELYFTFYTFNFYYLKKFHSAASIVSNQFNMTITCFIVFRVKSNNGH